MRRTSPRDDGRRAGCMLLLTKRFNVFNMLAVAWFAAAAGIGTGGTQAAPSDPGPARETLSPEPVLVTEAPDGHCAFEFIDASRLNLQTGFEPGLKSGTELLALYVPCQSLAASQSGGTDWLPEWVAVEKNTVTYPSDDARSLGSHGAVKQLCQDAQSAQWGHPAYRGADFAEMVKTASTKLSHDKPEVFLGVVGEEDHACYLAALKLVYSPSGIRQRFLVVQAFMQAGDRWVTQTFRRELSDAPDDARLIFALAKKVSKAFADKNR